MTSFEKEYYSTLSDVAIKFKAYTTYKTQEGALKMLIKKTKHLPITTQHIDLEQAYKVYDKAVELINLPQYIDRGRNLTGYTAFEDVLTDKCINILKAQFPEANDILLTTILNWAVQWHYLR